MRSTDKTTKPLLLSHHKWYWHIPWMIWHGFEGNQWTLCLEADCFFAWRQWNIRPNSCPFLAIVHEIN
jgi:hypothetical protein